MITAPVNKIIPFSSVDGPGNRTAVFFQGCNWDCCYCHNPETRNMCTGCMACVQVCPVGALQNENGKVHFFPERCVGCDTCIKTCHFGSSPRICNLTPEETFEQIKKQIPFISGVTVSGGECSLYCEFVESLFKLCKEAGLNTMMDSNGSTPFAGKDDLLAVTNGVMLDIKAFGEEDHLKVTAMPNKNTLENAVFLAKMGKLFEIRTVIVPGLFDIENTIIKAGELLRPYQSIHPVRYKLISYRPFGVREEYRTYQSPSKEYMEQLEELAYKSGFDDVVTT